MAVVPGCMAGPLNIDWRMTVFADERSQASSKRDAYVKMGCEDVAPARSLLFLYDFTDVVGARPFGLTDV